jgi:hypothetical protein
VSERALTYCESLERLSTWRRIVAAVDLSDDPAIALDGSPVLVYQRLPPGNVEADLPLTLIHVVAGGAQECSALGVVGDVYQVAAGVDPRPPA